MLKKWFKAVVIVVLILLPVGIWWLYQEVTKFPEEIIIAGGPGLRAKKNEKNRNRGVSPPDIIEALATEIRTKLHVQVQIEDKSAGSLDNLLLLQAGKVDFALYTPGTLEEAKANPLSQLPEFQKVAFVANLFSQPAHFIVRRGAGIESPADLKGKRVHLGLKDSGDYAMSQALLEHFNLKGSIKEVPELEYSDVVKCFEDDKLDAAFISAGVHAKVFKDLAKTGKCDLIDIPNGEALAKKHLFTYPYTIPAGLYSFLPRVVPESDVETVAAREQLLTHSDVNATLVQEVIKLVLDENFMMENELGELFAGAGSLLGRNPHFLCIEVPGAFTILSLIFT